MQASVDFYEVLHMNKMVINAAAVVVLGLGFIGATTWACGGHDGTRCDVAPAAQVDQAKKPQAKELSDQVKKGLKWLAQTQLENGAWGQGEESAQMGAGDSKLKTTANVADTCMALMAFVRSGNEPGTGEYKQNVGRAIAFLCAQVEESDDKSLFITALRGTRTQGKLGQYIDTFLTAQVLADVKNKMADESSTKRVNDALAKVIKKIELNQKEDGKWVNDGWAPTLAQAACAKALNTASLNGAQVSLLGQRFPCRTWTNGIFTQDPSGTPFQLPLAKQLRGSNPARIANVTTSSALFFGEMRSRKICSCLDVSFTVFVSSVADKR